MSLLDDNIIDQAEQICYDKVKEDVDMFISKHMSVNHNLAFDFRGLNAYNDCSSFSYGLPCSLLW
jgi:hypothetical protein